MAKRYGRNQRRKHRERIAELSVEQERLQIRYDLKCAQLRELHQVIDDWDYDIRQLLGAYSAFLVETPSVGGKVPPFRVDVGGYDDRFCPFPGEMAIGTQTVRLMQTLRHEISIEDSPHTPYLEQVVRLSHDDGRNLPVVHTAYSIEGRTLMRLGKRDIPYLAQKIAVELAAHWNGRP